MGSPFEGMSLWELPIVLIISIPMIVVFALVVPFLLLIAMGTAITFPFTAILFGMIYLFLWLISIVIFYLSKWYKLNAINKISFTVKNWFSSSKYAFKIWLTLSIISAMIPSIVYVVNNIPELFILWSWSVMELK